MDMTSNKSWYLNGHWKGAFDWGDLDLRAFYRDTDHRMNFLADKGGSANGGMPMNTETHSAGYTLKGDIVLSSRDTLRLGSEFHHQWRSEEHTSELQSTMRISYAVVCLQKKLPYPQTPP